MDKNAINYPLQISWLMPLAPSEDPCLLTGTLNCLAHQTLQANELIIAADGALPDALLSVIAACNLPWQLLCQSHNQGIGATLARVAPLCQGEFIVRIDSDDLYAPEHTEAVVNALRTEPKLGAVGCQLLELDMDRSRRTSARITPTNIEEAMRWLPWRNPLNHQTVALRRQALVDAGGYRHCPAFEDWDLWFRIAAAGYHLNNLPGCTAAARVNSRHRQRRHGWRYSLRECRFYGRQIKEGRLGLGVAMLACLSRLPWRLLPAPLLAWWMQSALRGSPPFNTTWLTQLLAEPTG